MVRESKYKVFSELNPYYLEKLKLIAKDNDVSLSFIIREILENYIDVQIEKDNG